MPRLIVSGVQPRPLQHSQRCALGVRNRPLPAVGSSHTGREGGRSPQNASGAGPGWEGAGWGAGPGGRGAEWARWAEEP